MKDDAHSLKRVLGRTDVLTLAFGTMIGWGWVVLSGFWIQEAGMVGSLAAFAIGAMLCIFVGLTLCRIDGCPSSGRRRNGLCLSSHGTGYGMVCRLGHISGLYWGGRMGRHCIGYCNRLYSSHSKGLASMGCGGLFCVRVLVDDWNDWCSKCCCCLIILVLDRLLSFK